MMKFQENFYVRVDFTDVLTAIGSWQMILVISLIHSRSDAAPGCSPDGDTEHQGVYIDTSRFRSLMGNDSKA